MLVALGVSDVNRPHGYPPFRWIQIVKNDFATISLLSVTKKAAKVAEDRGKWHKIAADISSM